MLDKLLSFLLVYFFLLFNTAYAVSVPKRIISLAPSVTELLFAIEAGPQIVAVTKLCNYPPPAVNIAKIGDITIDYERLMLLKPDLVVAEDSLNSEALKKLSDLKIRVLSIKNSSLRDISKNLRLLGQVTGKKVQGEIQARRIEQGLKSLRNISLKLKTRPSVFIELWDQPLMTAGPGTFLDDVIWLAGGNNIGRTLTVSFPAISHEMVLEKNPDIIVLANINADIEKVQSRPGWKNLQAVKRKRVYLINPDIIVRPGPRLLDGTKQLFNWFHPEKQL